MGTQDGPSGPRIIGGMFGLDLGSTGVSCSAAFLAEPVLKLATARSAFTLLARTLRPSQVWLPSYLCDVVLGAFAIEDTRVRFYGVDARLDLEEPDWLRDIRPGDLTVFIDYFGFNRWREAGADARTRGAWVVEDACQALLNERFCEHSHYVIVSPRKFVGVPDGGLLLARNGATLPDLAPEPPPASWWLDALAASQLRAEFDRHGGDRRWFELFSKTDAAGPLEPLSMSELSALLLEHRIDCSDAARRRRENYRVLAAELQPFAIFPELPPDVVPLGFPVRLRDRDRVRSTLFGAEIYPPVHWPIAGIVPDEFGASHRLAAEIMTLPCDQRYDEADMRRIVDCLQAAKPEPVQRGK